MNPLKTRSFLCVALLVALATACDSQITPTEAPDSPDLSNGTLITGGGDTDTIPQFDPAPCNGGLVVGGNDVDTDTIPCPD